MVEKKRCKATTVRGKQCKGRVVEGDYCYAHGGATRDPVALYQCTGKSRTGEPCFARVREQGGRCAYHARQAPS